MELNNFTDFVNILLASGFSIGGGNGEGIYAIVNYDWLSTPPGTPVVWHTGDPETDPWEWRIRVLQERGDIAYSKCFFKKSGYITREFYPYFLALRRGGRELGDEYADGLISSHAKRIYETVREHGDLPLHGIKTLGGFARDGKSKFDAALTELQMRLYLTICGTCRRRNARGEEYGWDTTVFRTTERFWEATDVFALAEELDEAEAYGAIRERVLKLNPSAEEKKIRKFAYGR
ncbi:MAG: hypothetical protein LBS51_00400 [Oscillospiraceae bacterium]|jgi:hypothetical protein|nr:hypothetical protein [Oscillospiraceae bacterium]